QNKYQKALIQPAVFSDRSSIDLGLFQAKSGNSFLPVNGTSLMIDTMKEDLIKSQKNQHNNLAKVILSTWKKQLLEWSSDKNNKWVNWDNSEVIELKNIHDLDKFLSQKNIDVEKIKYSQHLVKELMYNKKGRIKPAFLYMYDTFNDKSRAERYLESVYNRF